MSKNISRHPNSTWSFLYRIGSCPKCMRQSAFAAAASGVTTGVVEFLPLGQLHDVAFFAVSLLFVTLTSLWIAHVATFAIRNIKRFEPNVGETNPSDMRAHDQKKRRAALKNFAKLIIGGIAISAFPSLASADGDCSDRLYCGYSRCTPFGQRATCCPRGYPVLSTCNCRCYESYEDVAATGCPGTQRC